MQRRYVVIVGLVVLAALVVLWMLSDAERPGSEARIEREASFPRRATDADRERSASRRSWTPPAPEASAEDPLLASIVVEETKSAMVFELSSILSSSVAEMLMDCSGVAEMLPEVMGPEALNRLDRLAILDDAMIVTGHFGGASIALKMLPGITPVGDHGLTKDLDGTGLTLTLWRDELLIVADRDYTRRTVERLEGRGPRGTPLLAETQAYGDLYGVLDGAKFVDAVPAGQTELRSALGAVDRTEFHADVHDGLHQVVHFAMADERSRQSLIDAGQALIRTKTDGPESTAPIDRGMRDVVRGIALEATPRGVEATVIIPKEALVRRTAGCRFSNRGERPEGFVTQAQFAERGWTIDVPTNVVPLGPNEEHLAAEWPGFEDLGKLVRDIGGGDTFLDPNTLQTVTYRTTQVSGVCDRHTKLRQMLADDPKETFDDLELAGRVWVRQTTVGATDWERNLHYGHCANDRLLGFDISVPWPLRIEAAQRRAEAIITDSRIDAL